MSLSNDFKEFIKCLNSAKVEYLLVGGHALAIHGLPRFTKDIDFWVSVDSTNAKRIINALNQFGMGDVGLKESDFLQLGKIIQLGIPPNRIDIITSVDGLSFENAFLKRMMTTYRDIPLPVICKEDLIINKQSTGRDQDALDAKKLAKL
ncbi:MAG: hypothetical protein JXR45_20200 [Deltaproteobacteria bacterium]|nr:hypothetical protein [Deltaproteobacteria bacterium]